MSEPREYIFKLTVLGDGAVGKTSMVLQYTERKFSENYIMSIGANFSIKIMNYPDQNIFIRLQIWDLAGQKHFQFVRPSFYRGSFGCFFVFDITRRESFENIKNWIEEAKQYVPGVPYVLVGNKIDLVDERVVSKKEGISLAEEIGAVGYYETSAKTSLNIDDLFNQITEKLIEINIDKIKQ
jgi:small GTP-binding protein